MHVATDYLIATHWFSYWWNRCNPWIAWRPDPQINGVMTHSEF